MSEYRQRMFEVSAQWMNACGLGNEPKAFPIIDEYTRNGIRFVEVLKDGHRWCLIADWRGKEGDGKELV